jgi:nitroreductase
MDVYRPIPLEFERLSTERQRQIARDLVTRMGRRRSVRQFSTEAVDRGLIEAALTIAGSAPSGAHRQPWTWVVVTDQDLKRRIRAAAEEEERRNYADRMPDEWLEALAPLGTDEVKTHLTDAPCVLVLFARGHDVDSSGATIKNYYVTESCAIAAGFLIMALHLMGLACLTHTPSPMRFLGEVLGRPDNERALLVIPVGYPGDDAVVPNLARKHLDEVVVWR